MELKVVIIKHFYFLIFNCKVLELIPLHRYSQYLILAFIQCHILAQYYTSVQGCSTLGHLRATFMAGADKRELGKPVDGVSRDRESNRFWFHLSFQVTHSYEMCQHQWRLPAGMGCEMRLTQEWLEQAHHAEKAKLRNALGTCVWALLGQLPWNQKLVLEFLLGTAKLQKDPLEPKKSWDVKRLRTW